MEALERHLPASTEPRSRTAATTCGCNCSGRWRSERCTARRYVAGVTFTPGAAVSAERPSMTSLRLSFSLVDPPELDEGVKRLARALREVRRRDRRAATVPLS